MEIEKIITDALDSQEGLNSCPLESDRAAVFLVDGDMVGRNGWFVKADAYPEIDIHKQSCFEEFFRKHEHPIIRVGGEIFKRIGMGKMDYDDQIDLFFPYHVSKLTGKYTNFGSIRGYMDQTGRDIDGPNTFRINFIPGPCFQDEFMPIKDHFKTTYEFAGYELKQKEFKEKLHPTKPFSVSFMYNRAWMLLQK
jgi:hypothetical protein